MIRAPREKLPIVVRTVSDRKAALLRPDISSSSLSLSTLRRFSYLGGKADRGRFFLFLSFKSLSQALILVRSFVNSKKKPISRRLRDHDASAGARSDRSARLERIHLRDFAHSRRESFILRRRFYARNNAMRLPRNRFVIAILARIVDRSISYRPIYDRVPPRSSSSY